METTWKPTYGDILYRLDVENIERIEILMSYLSLVEFGSLMELFCLKKRNALT